MKEPTLLYNPESKSRTFLGSEKCMQSRWFSYWPVRYACIILSCLTLAIVCYRFYSRNSLSSSSSEPVIPSWDFILFTQSYPVTCCIWWQIKKGSQRCHFARDRHAWTVHGIWPTKSTTEGPFHCHDIPFNDTALETIKNELEEHWPSVGNEDDGLEFWKHEWLKHGTCAVEDHVFDSELTYFKLGLEWNSRWNLSNMLSMAGVTPSNTKSYQRAQLHDAVKSATGKSPYLDCYFYKELGIYLINEVRHCVSKDLELLDCDSLNSNTGACPADGIFYPDSLELGRVTKSEN